MTTSRKTQDKDTKYINSILYLARHANNKWFGAKKLAKMLYELDFDNYEKSGDSLTGDIYLKEHYGPLPKRFYEILRKMKNEGYLIYEPKAIESNGYKRDRIEPLKDFDSSTFTAQELESLQEVVNKWSEFSAKTMEDISHLDAPWLCAKNNKDELDYRLAPYRFGRNVREEEPDEFDRALIKSGLLDKAVDEFA